MISKGRFWSGPCLREYNNRTFYDGFIKPFTVYCGGTYLTPTPTMSIGDSFILNERARYNSDPLPDSISIFYGNSVITFTNPYDDQKSIVINYYAPYTDNIITRDKPGCATDNRGYYSRRYDRKRCYKNPGYIATRVLFTIGLMNAMVLSYLSQIQKLSSLKINIVCPFVSFIDVFASLISILPPVEIVFVITLYLFFFLHSVTTLKL